MVYINQNRLIFDPVLCIGQKKESEFMDNHVETPTVETQEKTKFCKHCGAKIPEAAVICTHCGCQAEDFSKSEQPSIVINNANTNTNMNANVNGGYYMGRPKHKWVAFLFCFFLGCLGAHKFYEGRIGAGVLYL